MFIQQLGLIKRLGIKNIEDLVVESTDQRIKDLINLMSGHMRDRKDFNAFYHENTKNLYVGTVICREKLTEPVRNYFGEEKKSEEELRNMIGWMPNVSLTGGSCGYEFARKFEDGIVQFVKFGQYWESEPGYSWAIFGHVVVKNENPHLK